MFIVDDTENAEYHSNVFDLSTSIHRLTVLLDFTLIFIAIMLCAVIGMVIYYIYYSIQHNKH